MISTNAARNVVGIIGNIISFSLFLSPAPTFYGIIKRKSTEEFKADPYLATVMNCMLWVFYGLPSVHPNSPLVVTINAIGLLLQAIYLTIYLIYGSRKQWSKVVQCLKLEIATMALIVCLVLNLAHTHSRRALVVGILCIVFGTFMYASPLTVMIKVISSKSVRYMPFYLSLTTFLNGACWTMYALIEFDVKLVIPNALGALFGAIQLILYACYYRTTNWDDDDVDDKGVGALPTTNPAASIGLPAPRSDHELAAA